MAGYPQWVNYSYQTMEAIGAIEEIIEGLSLIKSIQRGVAQLGSNDKSVDITITEVNPDKTSVRWLGQLSSEASGRFSMADALVFLKDETTITVERHASSGATGSVSWEVIEYV